MATRNPSKILASESLNDRIKAVKTELKGAKGDSKTLAKTAKGATRDAYKANSKVVKLVGRVEKLMAKKLVAVPAKKARKVA